MKTYGDNQNWQILGNFLEKSLISDVVMKIVKNIHQYWWSRWSVSVNFHQIERLALFVMEPPRNSPRAHTTASAVHSCSGDAQRDMQAKFTMNSRLPAMASFFDVTFRASKEKMKWARSKYQSTHLFRRDGVSNVVDSILSARSIEGLTTTRQKDVFTSSNLLSGDRCW